jgi:hypothetical protein
MDPMFTMLALRRSATDAAAEYLETSHSPRRFTSGLAGPLFVGELEKRDDGLDARVVHQDVDRAQFAPHAIYHRFDFGAIRYIRFRGNGPPPLAADPAGDIFRGLSKFDVVERDVRALLREHFGDALADSAARARY